MPKNQNPCFELKISIVRRMTILRERTAQTATTTTITTEKRFHYDQFITKYIYIKKELINAKREQVEPVILAFLF